MDELKKDITGQILEITLNSSFEKFIFDRILKEAKMLEYS